MTIVKSPTDHFADIRTRLAKVWAKPQIDRWLAKEHQNLSMRSPARAIHDGGHADVHVLVDAIEKNRG